MDYDVFEDELLPEGFKFPEAFLDMVCNQSIKAIGPWWFLHGEPEDVHFWLEQIREECPSRPLVPFAKYSAFDDIACFDGSDTSGDPKIYYFGWTSSPGWDDQNQGTHSHFQRWVEQAKRDAERWKAEGRPDFG